MIFATAPLHYLTRPGRPRLAYRQVAAMRADAPTLLFLPGYASDMAGTKATALFDWAAQAGVGCRLFDYAGCGASDGDFANQTLTGWLADALAMLDDLGSARVVVVGSSMGGWLMLHCALARPAQVAALIGIAAAPDFTDWGYTADQKAIIAREGKLLENNDYGPNPTLTTRALLDSGKPLALLGWLIGVDAPVHLIHGQADTDVPFGIALKLAAQLRSAQVVTTLVKDGDHRLSRACDIARLLRIVAATVDELALTA